MKKSVFISEQLKMLAFMFSFVLSPPPRSERPGPPRVFCRQRRVHVPALSTVCQQRPPLSPRAGRGSGRMARAHQQEDVSAGEGGGGPAGENRTFPGKASDSARFKQRLHSGCCLTQFHYQNVIFHTASNASVASFFFLPIRFPS